MKQLAFIQQKQTFSQAREQIDTLLKSKSISLGIKISFIVLGISWLTLVLFWTKLPPQIPLLYSRPWGEEQLVNKSLILFLPGLATGLTLINLRIAGLCFKKNLFLSQLISWVNSVIVILAAITLIKILLIIT